MIRLEDVRKSYREGPSLNAVLKGVSFEIASGEFVALMGTSGSGKTTLLNVIGALDQTYEGLVEVNGHALHKLNDAALSDFRNRTVGFVFQHFHLLPHLPVLDNVAMASWFDARRDAEDLETKARAVLERVGLGHKAKAASNHLSGGEKQRVAIARAIFNQPALLLADEPTGALDTQTGDRVMTLFKELNQSDGITILIVTHDPQVAAQCNRVIHIRDGHVLHSTNDATEDS